MNIKLILLALGASTLMAVGADYTFNSGDSEGWTYRVIKYSTGTEIGSGTAAWSDINNYPNYLTDPVGDSKGAAQALVSASDYSKGASTGDYILLQFLSPDLTTSSDWQGAASFTAKLLPSFTAASSTPDIYANLAVTVNDLDLGKERSFVSGTATPVSSATWTSMDFDLASTFSAASPPVVHYQVEQVIVTYWIAVAADRFVADPLIFDIDDVSLPPKDYGDAPALYPVTAAENGAWHTYAADWKLGDKWDGEADGHHSRYADFDDTHGTDDEDGVSVVSTVGTITVDVVAGTNGYLNAWMDFNRDGDWDDAGEQIFTDQLLSKGVNRLYISVPASATPGDFVSRWRFNETGGLTPRGYGGHGEVEDHIIRNWRCESCSPSSFLDYGDAPDDATHHFRTLKAHDGARHGMSLLRLGKNWDTEPDGQPSLDALLDDTTDSPDDEDGVRRKGLVFDPASATPTDVQVFVSGGPGVLDAWIDWNGDQTWDSSEHAIPGVTVSSGWNTIPVTPPSGITNGVRYARFRLTSTGTTNWYGPADDGEVEDYRVRVRAGGATNNPSLHIQPSGGPINITWDEDGMLLQQADTLKGPWTDLPGANSPYVVTPTAPQQYFRLLDEILMDGE